MQKNIIMLSGKARSGKTTAANMLLNMHDNQTEIISFAKPLKKIARDLFGWNGQKDEKGRMLLIMIGQILRDELDEFIGGNKDYIKEAKNCNDVLKKYFSPKKDFWVRLVIDKALMSVYKNIVIDDWRFKSEYFGLSCIFDNILRVRLVRSEQSKIDDRSEKDLDDFLFDVVIENGTYKDLEYGISDISKKIFN